jgi:ABC-type amino acid transport system permease subunit
MWSSTSFVHKTPLLVVILLLFFIIILQVFSDSLFPSFLDLAHQIAYILYNFVDNHLYVPQGNM